VRVSVLASLGLFLLTAELLVTLPSSFSCYFCVRRLVTTWNESSLVVFAGREPELCCFW
jgi:hypothetical protein